MIESQQVQEWMAMGEVESEARDEIKDRIRALLVVLEVRFRQEVPADLEAAIRASIDREQLRNWLVIVAKAESLDAFRQAAGL